MRIQGRQSVVEQLSARHCLSTFGFEAPPLAEEAVPAEYSGLAASSCAKSEESVASRENAATHVVENTDAVPPHVSTTNVDHFFAEDFAVEDAQFRLDVDGAGSTSEVPEYLPAVQVVRPMCDGESAPSGVPENAIAPLVFSSIAFQRLLSTHEASEDGPGKDQACAVQKSNVNSEGPGQRDRHASQRRSGRSVRYFSLSTGPYFSYIERLWTVVFLGALTDREIVAALRSRKDRSGAIQLLLDKYAARVKDFIAYKYFGLSEHDIEEVVDCAALRVEEKVASGRGDLRSFFFRVAVRLASRLNSKRCNERRRYYEAAPTDDYCSVASDYTDSERDELRQILLDAIRSLPEAQRYVLLSELVDLECSNKSLAEMRGVSESAIVHARKGGVKNLRHALLEKCRDFIE